jgi:hypothetical protein
MNPITGHRRLLPARAAAAWPVAARAQQPAMKKLA